MRHPLPGLAAVAFLLLLGSPAGLSGQEEFGTITDTRSVAVGALELCWPEGIRVGLRESVEILRAGAVSEASPPAQVRVEDRVRVPESVNARLRIAPARGEGILYLVPGVVCFPEIAADTVVRGLRLRHASLGEYDLFTAGDRPVVSVDRGSLIVDWHAPTPLLVLALSDTVEITGTTAALVVDSLGGEGLFFLQSGSATIRGLGAVEDGQVIRLRPGLPPTPLAGSGAAEGFRESIRFHTEGFGAVARRGWWTAPRVAGLAAAAAAFGCAVTTCWDGVGGGEDGPGSRSGTVVIRFPS